jgi:hypothetical protein
LFQAIFFITIPSKLHRKQQTDVECPFNEAGRSYNYSILVIRNNEVENIEEIRNKKRDMTEELKN